MSMKMRNTIIFAVVMFLGIFTLADAKKRDFDSSIFDKQSEFMKGFETGILVRSKKGDINEFGCSDKNQAIDDKVHITVNMVKQGINTAKTMLPKDNPNINMEPIFDMITEMIGNLAIFFGALSPDSDMSLYCRGMVFGLNGSAMMMKVANIAFKPSGRKHGGKKGEPRSIMNTFKDAMANVGDAMHD